MTGINDIVLALENGEPSNFKLWEFANRDGLSIVHKSTLESCQLLRQALCINCGEEVAVIITDATRTEADNEKLAFIYGWDDEGGKVSRNSKHLVKHGGIAVDIKAVIVNTKERVPQNIVGQYARAHFDWVKDDYADGHVHADNRDRTQE